MAGEGTCATGCAALVRAEVAKFDKLGRHWRHTERIIVQ